MNKKGLILFLLAIVCTISVNAQSHKGLRINEVMVSNTNSYVDEYGNRHAWIELYNTTRRTMNISSIFITTERVAEGEKPNPDLMYYVPRGDEKTKTPHLSPIVFFADGEPAKGTLHTAAVLKLGVENYIAIYDSDGLTKLDEVIIPANLPENCSFSRTTKIEDLHAIEGNSFDPSQWQICNGEDGKEITPGENNYVVGPNNKVEKFMKNDPNGIILTIMAMAIVFSALILLSICFFFFGKINKNLSDKKKSEKAAKKGLPDPVAEAENNNADDEVIAVIAMAIYQHLNAHDEESNVLTFKRRQSDWNSKIATLSERSGLR